MFPLPHSHWYSETVRMTLEEKGAYLELILYVFIERRPIKDARHVKEILGCDLRVAARLFEKLSGKFVRNQHGYTHSLVTEIIRNHGRFSGLDWRAVYGGEPQQEREREKELYPPYPNEDSRKPDSSQSTPRRARSAGKILRVPHVSDQKELDKFAKEHGIKIPGTYSELYTLCCDYARTHNSEVRRNRKS